MSLLYFEKSTFGMSRSGRYFACDRRVWSSRVGSSRVTQNRPVDIFLSLSLSLSLSLHIAAPRAWNRLPTDLKLIVTVVDNNIEASPKDILI